LKPALGIILLSVFFACQKKTAHTKGSKKLVLCSLFPVHALVREINGERQKIECLIPEHKDPHSYRILPGQIAKMTRANLIILVEPHSPFEVEITKHLPRALEKRAK